MIQESYEMYSIILLSENARFWILGSIIEHHRVMPLHTQLIAIKMNPKLFLLSQIIHLFQNCVHSKKIVTFQYNFGHYEHFLPKFQILVV